MIKIKTLNILSGIIAVAFIIIFGIVTFTTDYVKVFAFFIFTLVIVFLVVIIDLVFWFINKRKKVVVEKNGEKKKIIDLEKARELHRLALFNEHYSEYEKEKMYESVWGMGLKNTPIYVRISLGEFEGKIYGYALNMENSDKTVMMEFVQTMKLNDIIHEMQNQANLVAAEPRPIPKQEEEVIEDPTGRRIIRKRDITMVEQEKKKEEGLK